MESFFKKIGFLLMFSSIFWFIASFIFNLLENEHFYQAFGGAGIVAILLGGLFAIIGSIN